jgi:hypothetical protein
MASIRFADMQSRPTEFLDFTSLTLDEFPQLVPPFEAAFHAPSGSLRWRKSKRYRTPLVIGASRLAKCITQLLCQGL